MPPKYFFIIIYTFLLSSFTKVNNTPHPYPKSIPQTDTTPSLPTFLLISDIHLNSGTSQDAAHGDTGDSLWWAAKKEVNTVIIDKKPKFIIVLGDLPMHDDSTKRDSIKVRQNIQKVITYFKDSSDIRAGIPMIYVPGNNDSWNGDYSAFTLPDSIYNGSGYPFIHVDSALSRDHACIANDSLQRSIGCYSMYPLGTANKLKVIALNTVIFIRNKILHYSADPQRQDIDATTEIKWLLAQLKQAKQNGEKILLAMHVPPGIDGFAGIDMWYDKDVENIFLNAVKKYQNTIAGLLAGHTHMDGVRLIQDDANHTDALLISCPGIAPGHGNNPAMKLVEYNDTDYTLKNFFSYYMNYWNADRTGTVRDWNGPISFSGIAGEYDIYSMTMLGWFQKNTEQNIDKLVYSIYTDKSNKPDRPTLIKEINSSIYVGFRK